MESVNIFPNIPYETDWLGTNAVFYDLETSRAAHTISELLDGVDLKPDLIGISNFLNYGFSVFGRTVVENVRMTDPNSILTRLPNGSLKYEVLSDPVIPLLKEETTVLEVESLISQWFDRDAKLFPSTDYDYVLPLSGGLDSAMLGWFLSKRDNVYSYTYGISWYQKMSYEVVNARTTAKKLGLRWEQIKLEKFHNFMDMQHEVYGPSMHAHSMYHFEFFTEVIKRSGVKKLRGISGIYGDLWAGSWSFDFEIHLPSDLRKLAIRHGMYSEKFAHDFQQLHPGTSFSLDEENFIKNNFSVLQDAKFKVICAARMKMSLIRHLVDTPNYLGINTASPFLDLEIAMSMLNLPQEIRSDRNWQKTFLLQKNILPKKKTFADYTNALDFYGAYRCPPKTVSFSGDTSFLPSIELADFFEKARVHPCLAFLKIFNDRLPWRMKFKKISELLYKQQRSYIDLMLIIPLLRTFSRVIDAPSKIEN